MSEIRRARLLAIGMGIITLSVLFLCTRALNLSPTVGPEATPTSASTAPSSATPTRSPTTNPTPTPPPPTKTATATPTLTRTPEPTVVVPSPQPTSTPENPGITGTVYYVDGQTGSDANTGTLDAPWQTLEKVNGFTFEPGDTILFRRGMTGERLAISGQSGEAGRPITYGAYGIGPQPQLAEMMVTRSQHIVIREITVSGSETSGIAIHEPDTEYITIDRCVVEGSQRFGISIWTPDTGHHTITNCIVRDNGLADEWSSGVYARANDVTIAFCDIYNNGSGDSDWGFSHGIYLDETTTGSLVYGNIVHDNPSGHGIAVKGDAEVYRNFVYRNEIAGLIVSENGDHPIWVTVHSNIFFANAFGFAEYSQGAYPISVQLFHNTFYHNADPTWGSDIYVEDEVGMLEIINNVIATAADENVYELATQSNALIDHNCVYQTTQRALLYGRRGYTWSRWLEAGYDTNSIKADPLFVAPLQADFHLQADSPCIDAGIDVGISVDFDGNPRTQGGFQDIGAYEYYGGVVSTTESAN